VDLALYMIQAFKRVNANAFYWLMTWTLLCHMHVQDICWCHGSFRHSQVNTLSVSESHSRNEISGL